MRDNVIPLADNIRHFGMEPRAALPPDTRIVVREFVMDDDPVVVGIVADKVHNVTDIDPSQAHQTPRIGTQWRPEYIRFTTRMNESFIVVHNIERILN